MKKGTKNWIVNEVINLFIGLVYWVPALMACVTVWHFLLLDPWLSILGLTDRIEDLPWLGRTIIITLPLIPLGSLVHIIHEKVVRKFYRDDE